MERKKLLHLAEFLGVSTLLLTSCGAGEDRFVKPEPTGTRFPSTLAPEPTPTDETYSDTLVYAREVLTLKNNRRQVIEIIYRGLSEGTGTIDCTIKASLTLIDNPCGANPYEKYHIVDGIWYIDEPYQFQIVEGIRLESNAKSLIDRDSSATISFNPSWQVVSSESMP